MTAYQKELIEMSNVDLIKRFDDNITTQIREFDKYLRVTKSTQKHYDDIKSEMLRWMNHEDNSKRQEVSVIR